MTRPKRRRTSLLLAPQDEGARPTARQRADLRQPLQLLSSARLTRYTPRRTFCWSTSSYPPQKLRTHRTVPARCGRAGGHVTSARCSRRSMWAVRNEGSLEDSLQNSFVPAAPMLARKPLLRARSVTHISEPVSGGVLEQPSLRTSGRCPTPPPRSTSYGGCPTPRIAPKTIRGGLRSTHPRVARARGRQARPIGADRSNEQRRGARPRATRGLLGTIGRGQPRRGRWLPCSPPAKGGRGGRKVEMGDPEVPARLEELPGGQTAGWKVARLWTECGRHLFVHSTKECRRFGHPLLSNALWYSPSPMHWQINAPESLSLRLPAGPEWCASFQGHCGLVPPPGAL